MGFVWLAGNNNLFIFLNLYNNFNALENNFTFFKKLVLIP